MLSATLRNLQAQYQALKGLRWRLFAQLAPWLLALGVLLPLAWSELESSLKAPLLRDRDDTLQEATEVVLRTLASVRRDALFLSDLMAQSQQDDPGNHARQAQLLRSFAVTTRQYTQASWVDEQGREQLRIDMHDGVPVQAPEADLLGQETALPGSRRASGLPSGSVLFSELRLSTRQGSAGQPPSPVIQAASPLHLDGRPHGMVSIAYQAQRLLDRLSGMGRNQRLEVSLLAAPGYWALPPDGADRWADPQAHPERGVQATHPGLWAAMQAANAGVFNDDAGSWAFKRVALEAQPNAPSAKAANTPGLHVLVRLSTAELARTTWRWRLTLGLITAFLLAVVLRLTWQSGRAMVARRQHEESLQAANHALQESNDNLRSMQAELARADRLSSLGLMVAGVAHELNTPLGSATLALSTVQQRLDLLEDQVRHGLRKSDLADYLTHARQTLKVVLASVQRSAGIVRRFKQVAVDRTTMERRVFDLTDVLLDSDLRLRKWDKSHPVQLKLGLEPGIVMESYPGPLEQVVVNLLDNALTHAFANRPGGCITLRTEADGADHVWIWFSDDGNGVPDSELGRLFEPFYTTNRHAGGTGLGLHIVFQLVHDVLGGTVTASRVAPPGTGMVFTLHLPRKAPPPGKAAP